MRRSVIALAASTAADETKPLSTQPAELAFGWDELSGDGGTFTVLNDSPREQRPTFVFSVLRNEDNRALCDGCLKAELRPPPLSAAEKRLPNKERRKVVAAHVTAADIVVAGSERIARVRVDGADALSTPASGSYSGSVAIFDRAGNAFLRVTIKVVVPNKQTLAAPKPLGESATVTVHCHDRWHGDCSAGRSVWVPLVKDVVPGVDGAKLDLKVGKVGSVSGDHGVGEVRFSGKTKGKEEDGGPAVQLVVEDIDYPGSYEGKVDLLPNDDKAGEVKLKATVKTDAKWFVAAILAGILFETALLRFTLGNKLLRSRRRLEQALAAIDDAKARFANARKPWSQGYDLSQYAVADGQEVADLIATARRSHFADLPKETVDAIEAKITALAAGADELDGLDTDLDALEERLVALEHACPPPSRFAPPSPPQLVEHVRGRLYHGQKLGRVAEAQAQRQHAKDATVFAERWRGFECQLSALSARADAYRLPHEPPPTGAQQDALERLDSLLPQAFAALWGVVGAEDPAFTHLTDRILAIENVLAVLVGGGAVEPLDRTVEAGDERVGAGPLRTEGATARLLGVIKAYLFGSADETHVQRAARLGRKELLRALALIVLASVLALVTAANSLYVDTAWGTSWDYLTAFLWATTTKAALDLLLLPALEQLAGLRPLTTLLGRR